MTGARRIGGSTDIKNNGVRRWLGKGPIRGSPRVRRIFPVMGSECRLRAIDVEVGFSAVNRLAEEVVALSGRIHHVAFDRDLFVERQTYFEIRRFEFSDTHF